MVAVNIKAGLANQMFHYAFGRGLEAKGFKVVYDQKSFKPRKEWSFEDITLQDAFPDIEITPMPKGKFKWLVTQKKNRYYRKFFILMRKISARVKKETYIYESQYGYIPDIQNKIKGDSIFYGHWQSPKYFENCEEDIKKQFTFLPFDEQQNIDLANKMKTENSVAIHLRKGRDYLESNVMGKGLCGKDYYLKAVDIIKSKVKDPVFYVFTDNPEWVKENLPELDYTLVDWNKPTGKRSFRDMQLMTFAKHNIIANSTYSWWGAWLNPNPDKIVISPKIFFNPVSEFFSTSDVIPDSWIKINS